MIYSTFASKDEALLVAEKLLEEKLIACANILEKVTSVYKWEGELCHGDEIALIGKTQSLKSDQVIARIKALHSYDIPCVVAYPIHGALGEYADWVKQETQ